MLEQKIRCNCIRCREAGRIIYKNKDYKLYNKSYLKKNTSKNKYNSKYIKINTIKYISSKGEERFISLVDRNNTLYGYLRLRILNKKCAIITNEITSESAIIRELKVFGTSTPLGEEYDFSFQHKGFGKLLIEEAVKITKEMNKKKVLVMSAIGTQEYYKQFGFVEDGFYMSRRI